MRSVESADVWRQHQFMPPPPGSGPTFKPSAFTLLRMLAEQGSTQSSDHCIRANTAVDRFMVKILALFALSYDSYFLVRCAVVRVHCGHRFWLSISLGTSYKNASLLYTPNLRTLKVKGSSDLESGCRSLPVGANRIANKCCDVWQARHLPWPVTDDP